MTHNKWYKVSAGLPGICAASGIRDRRMQFSDRENLPERESASFRALRDFVCGIACRLQHGFVLQKFPVSELS